MTALRFWRSRSTRRKWVYEEERVRGAAPVIGMLYIDKEWLAERGDPESLIVSVAPGPEE